MIAKEWQDYLTNYILLKGETLHLLDVENDNHMITVDVIKRTARTRRTLAKLTLGLNVSDHPSTKLLKTFFSPNVKRQLAQTDQTYDWIRNGWLIREYRLEKDERTIKKVQYRMSYPLFKYQQKLNQQKEQEQKEQMIDWLNKWEETKKIHLDHRSERFDLLKQLSNQLGSLAKEAQAVTDDQTDRIQTVHPNWQFKKQITFLHFLLALYQIASTEPHFDWKQIGARYYRYIGGSKMFDFYKKDFIVQAETLLERPLHLIGLTSLGTITPIYFSGAMQGRCARYQYGSVHATTDLAVFTDCFKTTANVLWLVENRGVLTRMAYEIDFLTETNSFVLAIDGQLRSAHKQLIDHLAPDVEQVIIWTDVDEAGLVIGKEAAKHVQAHDVIIKWVVPPLKIATCMSEFEASYKQAIQLNKAEQEEEIGGVEWWRKWIKN